MSAQGFTFPAARRHAHLRLVRPRIDAAWAHAIDVHLHDYAGWLWCGPDGQPDVPAWLGDAWAEWVIAWLELHPGTRPGQADWPRLWARFVERWLSRQPEWRARVEAACREMEVTL